jgi:hypothetical protein
MAQENSRQEPLVTKQSLGWAGAAAFVACAVCCALPLLAVAGGGALATLAAALTPGAELVAAFVAAGATLLFFVIRGVRRNRACTDVCSIDASCCDNAPSESRAP